MKILFLLTLLFQLANPGGKEAMPYFENDSLLRNDLKVVWPLMLTVKIEYDLANAQLAFIDSKIEKEKFLKDFEDFIRKKYFKEVIKLNYFQGKLLILLIHKELGKTAYELLLEYRSMKRADFWNNMASMFGVSLKDEYHSANFPLLDQIFMENTDFLELPVYNIQP